MPDRSPLPPPNASMNESMREELAKDSEDRKVMVKAAADGRTGRFASKAERARAAKADQANRQIRKEADKRARKTARLEAKGVTVTFDRTLKPAGEKSEPVTSPVPAAASVPTLAEKRSAQASAAMVELSAMEKGWIRSSMFEDLPAPVQIVFLEALSLQETVPMEAVSLNIARAQTLLVSASIDNERGIEPFISHADELKLNAAITRFRSLQRGEKPRK